jgi:hypothetical protein
MAISHAVSSDPTHRIVNNERAAGEAKAPIPMQCPLLADIVAKSFWGDERKFLEPLMRFTRGDVRDHIASSKIDHGSPS